MSLNVRTVHQRPLRQSKLLRQLQPLDRHRNRPPNKGVYISMKDCPARSMNIFARFSKVAILLGITVIWLLSCVSVEAQESPTSTSSQPNTVATSDPQSDYNTSLNTLSTLYQKEVQRLEKQQQQSQELYNEGLISRIELEKSQKAVADARAKVEQVTKQITAANQPPPLNSASVISDLRESNHVWTTRNSKVDSLIHYYGTQYSVDPYLIYCLMSQESKFSLSATSPKGAQGLMQLMPDTAARYGVTNPFDIAQSIMGGTRYLKDLLKMFNGRVDLALAGYNAGENAVVKHGYTVPPYNETRNYVRLILARYGKKQTS